MNWQSKQEQNMVQVTRNRETRSMAQGGKFLDYRSMKPGEMVGGILTKEGVGQKFKTPNYTILVETSTMTEKNAANAGEFVVLNWSNILEQGVQELRKATNKQTGFYLELIYGGYVPKKDYKKGQPVTNQNHYHKMDIKGDINEISAPTISPAVVDVPGDDLDLE